MRPAGIRISSYPIFGTKTLDNWHLAWHGQQEVRMEADKLIYYRLYVLPSFGRNSKLKTSAISMGLPIGVALAA